MQKGIDHYNDKMAVSKAQRIQKWALLPANFSIPTGEMTPTMKLKKKVVIEKYADVIDKLYVD